MSNVDLCVRKPLNNNNNNNNNDNINNNIDLQLVLKNQQAKYYIFVIFSNVN